MSLILEALKKAERQHKLGEVPGIGAQPVDSDSSGLRGLGWLLLLLMAAAMLGLGLYLGGFRLTVPAEEGVSSRLSEVPLPSGAQTQTAPVPSLPAETAPPVREPAELETLLPPPPVPRERPSPPPPKPVPVRPLAEMPSGFVSNLPPLNIDIHSYDPRSTKRYVLINMEKYREGDYLAEGPQLIEILRDGVVLDYLGERFILPIGNQ